MVNLHVLSVEVGRELVDELHSLGYSRVTLHKFSNQLRVIKDPARHLAVPTTEAEDEVKSGPVVNDVRT